MVNLFSYAKLILGWVSTFRVKFPLIGLPILKYDLFNINWIKAALKILRPVPQIVGLYLGQGGHRLVPGSGNLLLLVPQGFVRNWHKLKH